MQIEFYSTIIDNAPIDLVKDHNGTFSDYLDDQVPAWRYYADHAISVKHGDDLIPFARWNESFDILKVTIHPRGGVFKSLGSILGGVFNIAFGWLMPSTSNGRNFRSPEQGNALESPQGSANSAKLAQIVPEIAGRYLRYPDYLTLPHQYYENARDQWLEFHVCIGPGQYQIDPMDVKVGDTPILSLGNDAEFRIFQPGEAFSSYPTANGWHRVAEVGGTSSGTAGLELSTEFNNRVNEDPSSYYFNYDYIERVGPFPTAWGVGTVIQVYYPMNYDVYNITVDPGGEAPEYQVSHIDGYFGHVQADEGSIINFGSFDSDINYRVKEIISESGGFKRIEFETLEGDPVLFPSGAGQTFAFGSNVDRQVLFFSGNSITVAPGVFLDSNVSGALVRYFGGMAYGEWTSEFMASPANESATVIQFDVFFPEGLGYIENNGNVSELSVTIEFQYQNILTGLITTYQRSYTNNTLDQIGFTEQLSVPSGRYLCRMRRVGAESTDTQSKNKTQWYGLKSLISFKDSYPDWTTMMVRLKSGGRIGAQSENKINVIATRILPEVFGDAWSNPIPTRSIASYLRYIALSVGYTDADIDFNAMRDLNSLWLSRGDNFDFVFSETTAKAALDMVASAGMAEITTRHGLITPIREGIRTVFEQSYSSANMTSNLRSTFRQKSPDDNDGFEIEYVEDGTWLNKTVRCFLPGDQGLKIRRVKQDGVTSRAQAWRIGMRMRREQRYINWGYDFSTSIGGLNSDYKSYVPLFVDMPGFGQSARILSFEGDGPNSIITLDAEVEFEPGVIYSVGYRRKNGTFAGPYPAFPSENKNEIISPLSEAWPEVSLRSELPHIYFGPSERFCFPALISSITPRGEYDISLSAVNYDSRKYDDDNNFPPD